MFVCFHFFFFLKKNQNIFGYLFQLNFSGLWRKQVEIRSKFKEKHFFFVKHFLKIILYAGLKHYFTVVGNLRLCRSNWCARAHARGNPYTCLWCKDAFFLFNKTITLNCVFIVRMFIAQPIDWEKGNEKISYLHVYINLCNMF